MRQQPPSGDAAMASGPSLHPSDRHKGRNNSANAETIEFRPVAFYVDKQLDVAFFWINLPTSADGTCSCTLPAASRVVEQCIQRAGKRKNTTASKTSSGLKSKASSCDQRAPSRSSTEAAAVASIYFEDGGRDAAACAELDAPACSVVTCQPASFPWFASLRALRPCAQGSVRTLWVSHSAPKKLLISPGVVADARNPDLCAVRGTCSYWGASGGAVVAVQRQEYLRLKDAGDGTGRQVPVLRERHVERLIGMHVSAVSNKKYERLSEFVPAGRIVQFMRDRQIPVY